MRKVKARKQYVCDCGNHIAIGDYYYRLKQRVPRLDENEVQIGIEYVNYYECKKCNDEARALPYGFNQEEYQEWIDNQNV